LTRTNEAGVVLALSGHTARAESLFVDVLSKAPRDARALTNLGNVALLRGDSKLALSYYARAARSAPTDPGIDLDRAVACLVQGDADAAQAHAARAVRASGGSDRAAALLGLVRADTTTSARAADATRLTPEEIEALLRQAATTVPAPAGTDSVRAAAVDSLARRRPAWRSAGPRSLDATAAATLLYWKQD
jgi:tetratricopeptide (TPR) repeat protein